MATFTLFDEFIRYLCDGTIDLDGDTFRLALSAAANAPTAATDTILSDITQISSGNGYTTAANGAGEALTSVTWAETGGGTGIWQFTAADNTWTASGGSIATFRYVWLWDDTPSSPLNPLVGFLDYGADVVVTVGNSFTVDVGASGYFQVQEA